MLIEQRIYDLHPHIGVPDFLENYEKLGLPVQKRILGGFVGYFVSEFGVMSQINHFWAFEDLEERRRLRADLAAEAEWKVCIDVVRPMIAHWENKILYPASFSPIRSLPVRVTEPGTAFDVYGDES